MALDWPNERYFKGYTRDTADWLMLSWDAQALFWALIRKADRSGRIHIGRQGKRAVAAIVGHPTLWDRIGPALEELLADTCIVQESEQVLLFRNYVEAQETPQSANARKQAQRERERTAKSHEASRDVTSGHAESRPVTPSLAMPAEPSQKGEPVAVATAPPEASVTQPPEKSHPVTQAKDESRPDTPRDAESREVTPGHEVSREPTPPPLGVTASDAKPPSFADDLRRDRKARAKQPKPPADSTADPRFTPLLRQLEAAHLELRGVPYSVPETTRGRDGAVLKRLLAIATPEEILRRWRIGIEPTRAGFPEQFEYVYELEPHWKRLAALPRPKATRGAATEADKDWSDFDPASAEPF